MITIKCNNFKPISQAAYNKLISSLSIHNLTCTCGMSGHLIKHAYYKRSVKSCCEKVVLRILRLKCKHCGKTHALLPSQLIPYSQVSFDDTVAIIKVWKALDNKRLSLNSYEVLMTSNLLIDFSNVKYIINQFLAQWSERLLTHNICLDSNLVKNCFKYFSRQFMQIKRIPNIIFYSTHIT
jgi:hypothetical protein